MKRLAQITISVLVLCGVAAAGYYYGTRTPSASSQTVVASHSDAAPRKILYYRNPMGEADTSPEPKQDSMGMDYIPVYEGEDMTSGMVSLSPEKIQLLGVRTEQVQLRQLQRKVRATGLLEVDERKQQWVAPRFAGWVVKLNVNQTGQRVQAGTPLLSVYSPELESAAREYQLARESGLMEVEKSARMRLSNWEISPQDLSQDAQGKTSLLLRAPISGVVLEKQAINGARFAAGEVLFKLADLSVVWLQAEVAEQDQGGLHQGQKVSVSVDAYPGEEFSGNISFVSPVLNEATRTLRVRVELNNQAGRLRPGMYATAKIDTGAAQKVLSVPISAVLDSGTRQTVLVQVAQGRFQPRSVKLGQRNEEWVEVLQGLGEDETVVSKANFLIDAESNLRSALSGMQAAPDSTGIKGGDHVEANH